MTDTRSSSGCAGAIGLMEDIAADDPYGRYGRLAREAIAALRTPALPSGEVELEVVRQKMARLKETECRHSGQLEEALLYGLHRAVEKYLTALASSPTQIAGDWSWGVDYGKDLLRDLNQLAHASGTTALLRDGLQRAYKEISRLRKSQAQPTPPLARWADTIESASLAISPKGSEALNALAAEVRAGGAAQAEIKPVGRQWIVDLIRDQFDAKPGYYRPGEWDDGAETIAEAILAQLPLLRAEGSPLSSTHLSPPKVNWEMEVERRNRDVAQLERQLAETDALVATHANSIDNSHPSTWPKGSLLAAAIERHGRRLAMTSTDRGSGK